MSGTRIIPRMPSADALNLFDLERAARERVQAMAYDYFASGADDERALRRNREAFERLTLWPRVLGGADAPDTRVTLLGREHPWPLLVAPTAFQRLAHPDGELATARAAASAGVTNVLSTLSSVSMEEAAAAGGPRWFQLYVFRDREITRSLVARAEAAGYEALVVTVDAPVLGRRERDARNRFELPEGVVAANLQEGATRHVRSDGSESGLLQYFASQIDPALTWHDLDWLHAQTSMPVVVKGILRADDAELAVEHGAAGVIVSNHGGRQLDAAPAAIEALPAVAAAVGSRADVLMDGGVRRGTDVVAALASGARAVLIGRPVLWGLATGGEPGARRVLEMLHEEFVRALALCGCRSVGDVGPWLLGPGSVLPAGRG